MVTSSKRAYAIPKSAALRAPAPVAVHCWPIPPQEMHTVLSQSLWDLWVLVCTRFVWTLWAYPAGMEFDSKCEFAPPTILLGLLLFLWLWDISSQLLQCHTAMAPTPTILLGVLWPWTWAISSQLLQQSAATAPDLGRGGISSQLLQRLAATAPGPHFLRSRIVE